MPKIDAPAKTELNALLGEALPAWQALQEKIETLYEMDILWATGGKAGVYEKKYRRGGKTLCALYPNENAFGVVIVLGRAEQEAFEAMATEFLPQTVKLYEETKVYHDGRWLLLPGQDAALLPDIERLLKIKRKPNKKPG